MFKVAHLSRKILIDSALKSVTVGGVELVSVKIFTIIGGKVLKQLI